MRSLREKLKAVKVSEQLQNQVKVPSQLYEKKYSIPLHELNGIEKITIDEIKECDPLFQGDSWDLSQVLFLDTETTGLSGGVGTIAFEIGVGFFEENTLIIHQYVINNYSQEINMLNKVAEIINNHSILITYNGKSFDYPLIESRFIMNKIRLSPKKLSHFDLLHVCRRIYKMRLGRCNLSTIEEFVLGKKRIDDLPGEMVPQRFFEYMKTGELSIIQDVLEHNYDDVLSLALLTAHVCNEFRHPEDIKYDEDILQIGKTLLRGHHFEKAKACFHKVNTNRSIVDQAREYLVFSAKKERNWRQVCSFCQSMIDHGQGGTWPYLELAKYNEHIEKNYEEAEKMSMKALQIALNKISLFENSDKKEIESIEHRILRIRRKKENIDEHFRKFGRK